ncbi:MAG TPA: hypothetical protein PLM22_06360 [Candidatus Sabulitectum sp.]|nr:hypothetical protein [Candidatus Sabulitectum sp.]HPR23468.1 hypothetical protein [Candidatus Sabulitectum sp.]
MMVCVLAVLFSASGWFTVAETGGEVHPLDCRMDEAGNYHLDLAADSFVTRYVYDPDGIELSSWITEPPPERLEFSFGSTPDDEGYSHQLLCSREGVSLWTIELGAVTCMDELPAMVVPDLQGGCIAVFETPENSGIWKVLRCDSSGVTVLEGEFEMGGGPMISVSDACALPGGGAAMTGVTDKYGMNTFMFLVVLDHRGDLLFSVTDSLLYHGAGTLLFADSTGVTVAGYTGLERPDGFFMPPYDSDVFISRYDMEGNEVWRTIVELPRENRPVTLHCASPGSAVLTVSSFDYEGHNRRSYAIMDFDLNRAGP